MAALAADFGEHRAAAFGRRGPGRIVRRLRQRRRQRRLESDERRHLGVVELVGMAVAVEVVRAGPAGAPALLRLHAVVLVQRVHGELAQRRHHALLRERPHHEVRVDAVEFAEIHRAVGEGGDPPEGDTLRGERLAHLLAAPARLAQRLGTLVLKVGGHLAGEQLDEPRAEQVVGVALVRELRIERVEVGALEAFRDEDVRHEAAGPARRRLVVAGRAGVRLRPRQTLEGEFAGTAHMRRDDRLGGVRAARAVERR